MPPGHVLGFRRIAGKAVDRGFDAAGVILAYLVFNLVHSASAYAAGRLSDIIGSRTLRRITATLGLLGSGRQGCV